MTWRSLLVLCCVLSGCGGDPEFPEEFVLAKKTREELPDAGIAEMRRLLLEYCGAPGNIKLLGDDGSADDQLSLGAQVYNTRCMPCHGHSGDGAGPAAEYLRPRPRDYRLGTFKFTSTADGTRATRDDIRRVIVNGAPGTAMPSFRLLPDEEIDAVLLYVLALTFRGELETQLRDAFDSGDTIDPAAIPQLIANVLNGWADEEQRVVRPAWDMMTEYNVENIIKGREYFFDPVMGCYKCHGHDGKGSKQGDLGKDDWGETAVAADLTSGLFHGGGRLEDVYRRIHSGIRGTPMPSFSNLHGDPETIWNVSHFVRYLANQTRRKVAAKQVERQYKQDKGLLEEEEDEDNSASAGGG